MKLFNLSNIFINNPFIRKVFTLTGGIACAQLIGILTTPILTRIYSSESFGQYGMFLAVMSIGSVFITWRYERGIVVTHSKSERHGLFSLVVFLSITFSFIFFLTTRFLSLGSDTFGSPLLLVIVNLGGLLALGLCFSGIDNSLRHLALKLQSFTSLSISRVGQAIVLTLVQIALGYLMGDSGIGLPFGTVFSLAFGVAWLCCCAVNQKWLNFEHYRLGYKRILTASRRNNEYPKFMVWSALTNSIMAQSIVLLVGTYFSASEVGQIFLAQKIMKGPLAMISKSISAVNFQESSEMQGLKLAHAYKRRVRKLLIIGIVPFAAIAISAPLLFSVIFGNPWREAGVLSRLLAPGLYLQFVFTTFIPLFTVLREQRVYLFWSISRLVLVIAGISLGAILGNVRGAVTGYTISIGLSYLMVHFILEHLLKNSLTSEFDVKVLAD